MPPWDPSLPGFFIELQKTGNGAAALRSTFAGSFAFRLSAASQSSTIAKLLSRSPPALGKRAFVFRVADQRFDNVLSEVNRLFPSQWQQAVELLELLQELFRTAGQQRDQLRATVRAIRANALDCLRAFLTGAPRPDTVPVVRHVRNLCQGD